MNALHSVHPGRILAGDFDANFTIAQAAALMGISEQSLRDITQCQADITKEFSVLLSLMLSGKPDDTTLLRLQCQYDCWFVASHHQWRHDVLARHQADGATLKLAAPLELTAPLGPAAPRFYAPHPGRILGAYLTQRFGLKHCAECLGLAPKTIKALIKGKIDVTKELAVLLGSVFPWHPAAFWLELQLAYDLNQIERNFQWRQEVLTPPDYTLERSFTVQHQPAAPARIISAYFEPQVAQSEIASQLAARMALPLESVQAVLTEQASISKEFAVLLSLALPNSNPIAWLMLQNSYDCWQIEQRAPWCALLCQEHRALAQYGTERHRAAEAECELNTEYWS